MKYSYSFLPVLKSFSCVHFLLNLKAFRVCHVPYITKCLPFFLFSFYLHTAHCCKFVDWTKYNVSTNTRLVSHIRQWNEITDTQDLETMDEKKNWDTATRSSNKEKYKFKISEIKWTKRRQILKVSSGFFCVHICDSATIDSPLWQSETSFWMWNVYPVSSCYSEGSFYFSSLPQQPPLEINLTHLFSSPEAGENREVVARTVRSSELKIFPFGDKWQPAYNQLSQQFNSFRTFE